jgi:general stress protein 26
MNTIAKEILDYKKTKDKLLSFLESKENSVMILATSANDVVMARPVLIINDLLDIYFFTWKHSRKCAQIEKNNLISLCKDKVEIEGTAEILGLMTSDKNRGILKLLKQKQPEAIKRWKNKPNMVIVKIKPIFSSVDGYFIHDEAYIEYIDFKKQYAYKVKWGNY